MKPLEEKIAETNNEISNLRNDISRLTTERDNLIIKLKEERTITDPILSIGNNAVHHFKISEINDNINSNDKYYTYYTAITKQNEKLTDKVNNKISGDFTYDQKAYFQYEQVSRFLQLNYILTIAYYVFVIIIIGLLFFVQKNMSIYLKIVIIVLLSIYPFIIYTIEYLIYTWGSYTKSLISGTVYEKK